MSNISQLDVVQTILNTAKVRLNDNVNTLQSVSGSLLGMNQYQTLQIVNVAWRRMLQWLQDLGAEGVREEGLIANIPACASTDPVSQVYLDFGGYFDGVTYHTGTNELPPDLLRPLRLWERVYVVSNTNPLYDMDYEIGSLPSVAKGVWNKLWTWRQDKLYMIGATGAFDIRMSYIGLFVDFQDVGSSTSLWYQVVNTPWFGQPVPITQCEDAFADWICSEVEIARQDAASALAFQMNAKDKTQLILNRDTLQPKFIMKASELQKMQDRYTPNLGPNTQTVNRAGTAQTH